MLGGLPLSELLLPMPAVPAGLKFYLQVDDLIAAVSSGMVYTPVTRADLAKGVPAPGWNAAR